MTMERIVITEHKVLTTNEYCGDHENHVQCPQHVTTKLGFSYHCGLFRTDDGDLYTSLIMDKSNLGLKRCKKCLEYFNE